MHGARQRLKEQSRFPRRLRPAAPLPGQAAAIDKLQGEERTAVLLPDLEDLNDIGVLQSRERLCLAEQPRLVVALGAFVAYTTTTIGSSPSASST